jgi:hypothetical protein
MDTQNIIPVQLNLGPVAIWNQASMYFKEGHELEAKAYLRLMCMSDTTNRPVLKALQDDRLRNAMDKLLSFPFMEEFVFTNVTTWTQTGGITVKWYLPAGIGLDDINLALSRCGQLS